MRTTATTTLARGAPRVPAARALAAPRRARSRRPAVAVVASSTGGGGGNTGGRSMWRAAEAAGGRAATLGLLGTSVYGNALGMTAGAQLAAQPALAAAATAAVVGWTLLGAARKGGGLTAADVAPELAPGRGAMVVMAALLAAEAAWPWLEAVAAASGHAGA